ncbi:hypothetical protein K9K77_03560 [Candidatus Babeliales bacterium]|nr:hypothetical protein [Candidatus Babeliales bacterium]
MKKIIIILLCLSIQVLANNIEIVKIKNLKLKKLIGQAVLTPISFVNNGKKETSIIKIKYCGNVDNKYIFNVEERKKEKTESYTFYVENGEKIRIQYHVFKLIVSKETFYFK